MEYFEKHYSKSYIEKISSEMTFDEFLRLVKEISAENGVQLKVIGENAVQFYGSDTSLNILHNELKNINNVDISKEDSSPHNYDEHSNNDTDPLEIPDNADRSIIDQIVLKFTNTETDDNETNESPYNQHSSTPDNASTKSADLVLNSVGLLDKPAIEDMTSSNNAQASSTGVLGSDMREVVDADSDVHFMPEGPGSIAPPVDADAMISSNVKPVGGDDLLSINQSMTSPNIHSTLLSNDVDDEILDISSINTSATLGLVTFNNIGDILTYSTGNAFDYLATGETTTDTFSYTASDGLGGTDTVSVTVTVTGINDAPIAQNDALSTDEDTDTNGNVLSDNGNGTDSDIDTSDSITVSTVDGNAANINSATAGSNGGLFTIQTNGTFTFTVGNDFQDLGTGQTRDTLITYTITDNHGATSTASVTITITGINDMPSAVDDGIYNETDEGGNDIIISEADLIANDTDPESDPLTITNISVETGEGSIIDNGDGTWTYTPPADSLGFNGLATLTYTLEDNSGLADTATFDLRVFNVLSATNGNDTLTHESSSTSHKLFGLDGDDTITGSNQRDILIGGNGSDTLIGNSGDDDFIFEGILTGTDTIDGGSGSDRILGSVNDDTFSLSSFSSISEIDMGAGNDTLLGTSSDDAFNFSGVTITDLETINGNGGNDTIIGTSGSNTIDLSNVTSLIGFAYIDGGSGNDTIHGSQSADQIILSTGSDSLYGEGGDDIFQLDAAQSGKKAIHGGDGNDQILGTAGDEVLHLSALTGVEHIDLGTGANSILIDNGDDVDFSSFTATTFLNIDFITDDSGNETVIGSQDNDTFNINADGGNDTFNGHDGNDTFNISGTQNGDDRIDGGTGYDQILGSAGDDFMRIVSLTNIEHIDLGTGTNTIFVDSGDDIDLSSLAAGDFLNVSFIADDNGSEDIIGSQGDDVFTINADGGNDVFNGHDGNDTFNISGTQNGDDRIDGGTGYDQILGSAGDDFMRIVSLTNIEHIDLGTGTNTIFVDSNDDIDLSSLAAGDFLNVSFISDDVSAETITGSQGDDVFSINADNGNDVFNGHDGNDTFIVTGVQNGDDRIDGGTGYDQILGSAGDDTLRIDRLSNIEHIDLGTGSNTIIVDYGETLDLSGFANGDVLNVVLTDDVSLETIHGSQGDDVFRTRADNNADVLYGEDGADTFMFTATQYRADTLADFDVTEGDRIDISDILSYDSSLGDLISDFVQLVADADGDPANGSGSVTLMVDVDGSENGSSFQSFAVFDDQGQTLADLINNGHLVL